MDPLLATVELPFREDYYPAGFRLHLTTNSADVLKAARACWSGSKLEFEKEPLDIRVIVRSQGARSPEPSFRRQLHLHSVVGDADNFAVADLDRLFAFLCVSAKTAADHAWLRWFFLESVTYTLLAQRYVVPAHAACVAREGRGILLCGPPGAGKSTLSFACARAGLTFVSDDCTWLLPDSPDRVAIGRPAAAHLRRDALDLFPDLTRFVERPRPNGKNALEVALRELPGIETAAQCSLRRLAFLERTNSGAARIEELSACEAFRLLSQDRPVHGPNADDLHQRTLGELVALPAYRLHYAALEDGCKLVESLA